MTILEIDPASSIPLYRQIYEQVKLGIAVGALREGDRLPPVRELASRLAVNRNTAARAVRELESDGLIRTRAGQGSFVLAGAPPVDRAEGEQRVDAALDAVLLEASILGVPLEELSWRLVRRIEQFRARLESGPDPTS